MCDMKKFAIAMGLLLCAAAVHAEIRSFTISFGAEYSSTKSLDNSDFLDAVASGRGYIGQVTGVVNVFPETESLKMSSSKNAGGFNIHFAEGARIIPEYIEVVAARYDNNRDADASLTLFDSSIYIPETTFETYRIDNESLAPQILDFLTVQAYRRVYLKSVSIFYDTANGIVDDIADPCAAPFFTPAGGNVSAGSLVSVTCSTPGAEIHYTLDGSTPDAGSTLYTAPLTVDRPMTIRAVATAPGFAPSEVTEATFTVDNHSAGLTAYFNFNDPGSLHPAPGTPDRSSWINLDGRSFTDSNVAVSFAASATGNTHVRLYNSYDAGCDLRVYDAETVTVSSLNPSMHLVSMEFTESASGTSTIDFTPSVGEFDLPEYKWYAPEDETVDSVVLTSVQQSRISSLTVTLASNSGIPSLGYDRDEHAVYYTMTGIRVGAAVPVPGVYIRVTPRSASKVIVKTANLWNK